MTKKEKIEVESVKEKSRTLIEGVGTIFMNFNTQGNIGKTTENKGIIEFMHAAGYDPVLISADPENKDLLNLYGSKDEFGALTKQELGKGVIEIDLAERDGKLADLLSDPLLDNRDALIDGMGGAFDQFVKQYNGVSDFYQNYPHKNFVLPIPISNMKHFENLDRHIQVYKNAECEAKIEFSFIFSKGRIGSDDNYKQIIERFNAYNFSVLPPNISIKQMVFETKWTTEEMHKFFKENIVRDAIKDIRGNTLILANKFLNERDKAWSDALVTPERKAELALLPHPTDSRNGRLWGSTLYGPHWKP